MGKSLDQTVAPIARKEPIFRGSLHYISEVDADIEPTVSQHEGFLAVLNPA